MSWQRYGMVLLLSNAGMMLLGYLLRIQDTLPFDALQRASQSPDLAFNTAASFITNTNWQAYAGESSLSNFSQMAVITFLMVVSAATGVAAAGGFIRGLSRKSAADLGNYWVDFTRVTYRVLLPLSFVMALVYVWRGMPQTLASDAWATTLEGARQQIVMGRGQPRIDQAYRHERRRLLQHERRASVREPDAAHQHAAHAVDAADSVRADLCARHDDRPAPPAG